MKFHLGVIVVFVLIFSLEAQSRDENSELSHEQLQIPHEQRKRRGLDDEDVINRFEMERVSPLYDIIRNLPPFDDNWIPNPVTDANYPLSPTKEFKNESTAYGEFKIEVSKDEEHVVSESGRQFQENAALNWFYSAETYSSVNHQNNSILLQSKFGEHSPRSFTTRKLDEEHVVSHIPSLRGGRGTFIDFNLIQSPTTPKVDVSTSSKTEESKPNITTRYILLQSGRIVAINVTSSPSVYSKPGTSGNNPFFFGSRIRNINNTKFVTNSEHNKQESSSTAIPITINLTTHKNYQNSEQLILKHVTTNKLYSTSRSTIKPQTTLKTTIKPKTTINAKVKLLTTARDRVKPQNTTRTTIMPHISTTSTEQSSNRRQGKSQSNSLHLIKPTIQYTKLKSLGTLPEVTKPLLHSAKELVVTDEAQRWWKEMKAAKKERKVAITTNLPSKPTPSSRNAFDSLIDALRPSKGNIPYLNKTLDYAKKPLNDGVINPSTDSITSSRRDKLPPPIKPVIFVPSTAKPSKLSPRSELRISARKEVNLKAITTQASLASGRIPDGNNPSNTTESDLLESPLPTPKVRHEFARIATSTSVSSTTEITTEASTLEKISKNSSRRPRYRGLSHVNLQAPIIQISETTTVSPKKSLTTQPHVTAAFTKRPIRNQVHLQPVTESPRMPITSQLQEPITSSPPRQPRNGFHLRNSVSFQTIPPGSLTDRRTLTRNSPVSDIPVENVPPPIEDLLIISFEPTRKSTWAQHSENVTASTPKLDQKSRNYHVRSEQYYPAPVLPKKRDKIFLSTPEPSRKTTAKSFIEISPKEIHQTNSGGGHRVGRNFRNNNSRSQAVDEKVKEPNSSSTTKKPYRVYYFEPKRKRAKNTEEEVKKETPKNFPSNDRKPDRTPTRNVPPNRGYARYTSSTESPNYNRRQPKQLSVSPTSQTHDALSKVITTPKLASKRFRSSPFIWHRPNVGTARSTPGDVLIEVIAKETSSQQPSVLNNGNHRSVNVRRTG